MEQLSKHRGHKHPATKPPRSVLEPPVILQGIVCKLGCSCGYVDGHRKPKLIAWVHTQGKASKTSPNRWRQTGCQSPGNAGISLSEWGGILCKEIGTEAGGETMEDSVEKEDEGD